MKNLNKFAALALSAVALSSCDSLDTEYLGGYVTEDQKVSTIEKNPDMGAASVNAIFSSFGDVMSTYSSHFDIGYPGLMIGTDLQTADMVTPNNGYNWYYYWCAYSSPTASGTPAAYAWYKLYDQIFIANNVVSQYSNDETNEGKFFLANALAARAFDYWMLAQLFQFNYEGHESSPCVPIITNLNSEDAAANGVARSTVQEVYDQINSDLNQSIALFESSTYTREEAVESKPKRMIDLSVAYGLRARVNLTMHKYAAAAQDAQTAINHFSGSPYSIDDVSKPAFCNLDDDSWMWGIAIAETDGAATSGIVNFPSWICTFCRGYVSLGGVWKAINSNIYANIPNNDVRKGWFLDENLESPNISSAQKAFIDSYSTIDPYTNVKFDSYNSVVYQSTNASDIPLMRIEEMYYILAEGQAMSGQVEQGRQTFESFIKTYRNPRYTLSATTAEDVQEAIYQDRRVEFWGEGLAYLDVMRLNKSIDRRNANFPAAFVYYIPNVDENAELAKVLIYCIPTAEVTGNAKISESDNNPSASRPTPITD
jgi:hypothetical protein